MLKFNQSEELPDVLWIVGKKFPDDRGYFCESFRQSEFEQQGLPPFVQENHSFSKPITFRGLHYQINPKAQGKLVHCVSGEIWDYVVDIRKGSPTYGKHVKFFLNGEDITHFNMVYVPPGFAHGFYVTGMYPAHVVYKVTEYYSPQHEGSVRWDDPFLDICKSDVEPMIISDKDMNAPLLKDATNNFVYGAI